MVGRNSHPRYHFKTVIMTLLHLLQNNYIVLELFILAIHSTALSVLSLFCSIPLETPGKYSEPSSFCAFSCYRFNLKWINFTILSLVYTP